MVAPPRKSLLAVAGALLFALGGCGGGDDGGSIPADDASEMLTFLNATETQVQSGNCDVAVEQADQLVAKVDELPAEVGVETKAALREAAQNLVGLTQESSACVEDGIDEEPTTTDTGATETTDTTDTTDTTTDTETETDPDEETDQEETTTTGTTTDTETEPPPVDEGPVVGGEGEIDGGPPSGGVDDEKR